MDAMQWKLKGRCYKFGDDLQHDGPMMSFKHVIERVYDPEVLVQHLFEESRPEIRAQVKPGDIIVAGKNFGKSKPHVQAYIAMRALGLGVVCESMPFLTYRAAVGRGLVFMTDCTGVSELVNDGDELEVDFEHGDFINHRSNVTRQFKPLPEAVREIIALGGTSGVLKKWWNERNSAAAVTAGGAR